MKVQIIQLEPHDDRASTLDKLGWVQAPRALLVWPARGEILHERLDLALLQRRAEQRVIQLGLVTHDPAVREHAASLGIPVFDSADNPAEAGWRQGRRNRRPASQLSRPPASLGAPVERPRGGRTVGRSLRAGAAGFVAFAWIGLGLALLPWAEAVVHPETVSRSASLELELDPGLESPGAAGLPGREILVNMERTERAVTSGNTLVPATAARGSVVFTNLTSEPVELPQGTGLRAGGGSGVRFESLADITLPGAIGATREVQIQASAPGPGGNLPALSIDSVEGPLGLSVRVENPDPTSGGSSERRPAVSSGDLDRLEREVDALLAADAVAETNARLAAGEALASAPVAARTTGLAFNRAEGDPAESVSLTKSVEFRAWAYEPRQLEDAAGVLLRHRVPSGWAPVPGSLVLEDLSVQEIEGGPPALLARVQFEAYKGVEVAAARQALRGSTPAEAVARLKQATGLDLTRLTTFPGWWPRTPFLPHRISIHFPWEASP